MFKLSSISASTEFQPLKEPKTEIPSVELVAEFVKVELQEFRLYVMVGVKDAPLGVADGDMYPRQNLSQRPCGKPLPRPFQGMRMCWNRP